MELLLCPPLSSTHTEESHHTQRGARETSASINTALVSTLELDIVYWVVTATDRQGPLINMQLVSCDQVVLKAKRSVVT